MSYLLLTPKPMSTLACCKYHVLPVLAPTMKNMLPHFRNVGKAIQCRFQIEVGAYYIAAAKEVARSPWNIRMQP